MTKVLFVCLGNICRSPTAEGVFRDLVRKHKLNSEIETDSAGTSGWHIGAPPDPRSQAEARKRGIDISQLRSRKVEVLDFERFDYVIAMDDDNLQDLHSLCPTEHQDQIYLFTDFASQLVPQGVPDPYYGGPDGFSRVFDLVLDCSKGLLAHINRH